MTFYISIPNYPLSCELIEAYRQAGIESSITQGRVMVRSSDPEIVGNIAKKLGHEFDPKDKSTWAMTVSDGVQAERIIRSKRG